MGSPASPGYNSSVTIDAGRDDGIKPNETVLNGAGLVGTVTSVAARPSTRSGASGRGRPGTGREMKTKTLLTMALPIIGGINWGLVAAGRFDVVATLTGNRFGQTNAASRTIYGGVGVESLVAAAEVARQSSGS